MAVTYRNLLNKPINELVFAGTHDAGITSGGGAEKTQTQDIGGQASSGARIFDLRVAVHSRVGGGNVLEAYHGKGMHKSIGGNRLVLGTWGGGLQQMLEDARRFVTTKSSEFLFLKFDHCKNWDKIADMCGSVLGPSIYTGGGNLNTKDAGDLSGKVVVLFAPNGLEKIGGAQPAAGILGIRSLHEKDGRQKDYDPGFAGIQYHGKGGTSAMNGKSDGKKLAENVKKQTAIMSPARSHNGGDPNVMGMMYWTSTGFLRSIKKRDAGNWNSGGFGEGMRKLWLEGMAEYIDDNLPNYINRRDHGSGAMMKRFMPNFVMIDFADAPRCQAIFDLNQLTGNNLVYAAMQFGMLSPQRQLSALMRR